MASTSAEGASSGPTPPAGAAAAGAELSGIVTHTSRSTSGCSS